jgi:glycosyltransferase involved in cell wall biosynthesis
MKVTLIFGNITQFSLKLIDFFNGLPYEFEVLENPTELEISRAWETSDLIWWEWCKNGIEYLTSLPRRCPIIVRGRAGDIVPRLEYACIRERCRQRKEEMLIDRMTTLDTLSKIDWRKVDVLFFNAPHIKREFESIFPNVDCKMETLLFRDFQYEEKEEFPKVAIMPSRISIEKDLWFAMEAFTHWSLSDWKLIVQGVDQNGCSEFFDKQYYDELMFKINKSNLAKIVEFRKWNDLNSAYKEASIVLNTSVSEGIANTVMEGMAMGCYPIVRNWIGAAEYYPTASIVKSTEDLIEELSLWGKKSDEDKRSLSTQSIEAIKTDIHKGSEDEDKVYRIIRETTGGKLC